MTLSAANQTATEQRAVQKVMIVYLDFDGDPVQVWDGPGLFAPTTTGDAALDGKIFSNIGSVGEISNIVSTDTIPEPVTISLSGVDLDDPALRQVVRDKAAWRGRDAYIWMGFIDLTDNDRPILHYPERLKFAYMASIEVSRDKDVGVITLTIDEDLDRAQGKIYRYADQRDYYPTDTAADYMHALANSPLGVHGADFRGPIYRTIQGTDYDFNTSSNDRGGR